MMPNTPLLYILFALGAITGCWRAYRLIITNRRPVTIPDPIYNWEGGRLSSWKYEPQASMAILVHTSAVAALGAASLFTALKPPTFNRPPFTQDATMVVLAWIIEGGSIALAGYLVGALLAYPLASFERKLVAYAVSEAGIAHGRILLPWRWFSHFSLEPGERLLRLYSPFAPDMPNLLLRFPDIASLEQVAEVLGSHLPQAPLGNPSAWYRTGQALVPVIALLSVVFVVLGWLATQTLRELALFSVAFCTGMLASLGGQLISTYGFGSRGSWEKKSG